MQDNDFKSISEFFPSIIKPTVEKPGIISKCTKVCPIHGEYAYKLIGRLKPGTTLDEHQFVDVTEITCPLCADSKASEDVSNALERSEWLKNYQLSNVPMRFKDVSLKGFKVYDERQNIARELCKEWIKGNPLNLVFLGRGGTGKSNLLCASIRYLVYLKHPVKYITEEQFCSEIKATYSSDNVTELSVMEKYANYEYLVIDEIGRSVGTEKDMNLISTLIIKRYENMKHTAMASNLTQEKLEKRFDAPVYRKLTESAEIFLATWMSYSEYLAQK